MERNNSGALVLSVYWRRYINVAIRPHSQMPYWPNHWAGQVEHFGEVAGGTGIRFYKGALYSASGTAVYRFTFRDDGALLPGRSGDHRRWDAGGASRFQ